MAKQNEAADVVSEFLDLWQKQFSYISKDSKNVESGMQLFQQMQDNYLNALGLGDEKKKSQPNNAKSDSVANILRDVGAELSKLNRRIGELERRIAKLESKPAKASAAPAKKAAKARPTKAKPRAAAPAAKPAK